MLAALMLIFTALGVCASAQARDRVDCKSSGHQYNECRTSFRDPVMVNQLSGTQCVEGKNWGSQRNGTVWVDKGCSGTFAERGRSGRGYDDGYQGGSSGGGIECRSSGYAFSRCSVPWRSARLVRQLSSSDCDEGEDWGVDRSGLWVDNGCSGYFVEDFGGGRHDGRRDKDIRIELGGGGSRGAGSLVCESQKGKRAQCWLPNGARNANLETQLSSTKCRRGDNWDVSGNQLWVDGGCRGQFRYW